MITSNLVSTLGRRLAGGLVGGISLLALAATTASAQDLTLAGKTIGVAVVGTQHFWDREAFKGATETIEKLGGTVVPTDGGRDNQVHANNHDVFITRKVDAVVTILGDASVDPKLKALKEAGIPVFTVDHLSPEAINNTASDNYYTGSQIGILLAKAIGGKGKVAVFNAFSGSLQFCGVRYDLWKYVLEDFPEIEILKPELAEVFSNSPEDARKQTLALLEQYPKGTLDAIHVACWDQPAIGVVQAIEEAGRGGDVVVTAVDAGPETLEIIAEKDSPFVANIAQQPYLIGSTAAENVARHFAGETLLSQTFVPVIPVDGPEDAKRVHEQPGYGTIN